MLSLLTLERKQTNSSNSFRIRIFFFLSYSFGMEAIDFSYILVVPSKTIPDSRLKWAECIPVFRPKRRKNTTRWAGTYLYGIPRNRRNSRYSHCFGLLGVQTKFIHQSNQSCRWYPSDRLTRNCIRCLGQRGQKPCPDQHHIPVQAI